MRAARAAHPRSRGENRMIAGAGVLVLGSSPLTRGKQSRSSSTDAALGLIPAHAGKTGCSSARGSSRRAHPRSRGENTTVGTMPGAGPGSSPLTRGKRHAACPRRTVKRLIPAHAGKTAALVIGYRALRAHPRSRGENGRGARAGGRHCGSSPLTRGKRAALDPDRAGIGLIPAHAGKTKSPAPKT